MLPAVTSKVLLSGKVAVAVSCTVSPTVVRMITGALRATDTGTGLNTSKEISASKPLEIPATIRKRLDCPRWVTPFSTQVTRARTGKPLSGMLLMLQLPSALTRAVRLRMLITQFSFKVANCPCTLAWAGASGVREPAPGPVDRTTAIAATATAASTMAILNRNLPSVMFIKS